MRAWRDLPRHDLRDRNPIQGPLACHTFRHTYSTLLRSTGAERKIMQQLLRHSTIRVTLDTYTQAVTTEKRKAQDAVLALLFQEKHKKRKLCLGRFHRVYLILCLFVPRREWSTFG